MKKLMQIFMVLFVVCVTANAQTFTEDFTGFTTGVNLAGQGSWTKGGTGPELTVANTTPLTYPLYNSGGGEYAVMPTGTTTSARVYKTFASPKTNIAHSTLYYSVLLRLSAVTAASNGYFMSFGNSGTGTQYAGKLFARASGAGFNIGVSKTSNTAAFSSAVLDLNKTYLIVVRYNFNNPGFGTDSSADDAVYAWVNPAPTGEPDTAIADCKVPSGTGGGDFDGFSPNPNPYDVGNILWHTRNATNPVGAFDGIRVGFGTTSALAWSDLKAFVNQYDDPQSLTVKNASSAVTLDGKLDEADWASAPTLLFGNGAFLKKQAGEQTVTNGTDVKASFSSYGVTYHLPNTDSSVARVKFLRKGTDLFIGITSNDKSICKFDWEADGLFLIIKNAAGVAKQYKLYYQNITDTTASTMRYEEDVLNSGAGVGFLAAGSTANDTTNVDNGYSAELRVKLASLGFDATTTSLDVSMAIFDPDGFQFNSTLPWPYGMAPFDSARGSYFKSWWGSEWGDQFRTLKLEKEVVKFDDPASIKVKNAAAAVTVDGKLDEADWASAPTLLFGNGAYLKKQAGESTVTGEVDVKSSFDVNSVTYHLPNKDSSLARVKFLRKGTDLYIGITSNDKSICRFDWEGDGLFLKVKNAAGDAKEYKLYYQNIDSTANTMRLEEAVLNSSSGMGYLPAGSTANDTTNVDNGYSAEFRLKLASLGFDANTSSIQVAMSIFDPDGFQFNSALPWPYGMMPFDSARGSYYKSWWGSEWGDQFRELTFDKEIVKFDDPQSLTVKNASTAPTIDGKLDEADWNGAPTLIFGNGAYTKKQSGEQTVTGEADVKASFDSYGVTYHKPNTDSSVTRVKFLRKGTDLYIGMQSNDKSICKFDWEADGMFLKVKNAAGEDKEYKLYYQNIDSTANTMRLEEAVLNSSTGKGFLPAGSTANDTTNVDNGYTAEFRLKLASLGYDATVKQVQLAMSIFDPDGFQFNAALPWPYGMMPFDSARGSYYKSWWGSEWGGTYRTLTLTPEYDNPDTMTTTIAANVTVDGKLDEPEWATAPALVFGPPNAPKTGTDKTVTSGVDVKASFDVNGVTYHLPYKDTSYARVKFLQKGTDLYIGISSNDKSICKFDWEADGMFLKIKNAAGDAKEYKLYYQNIDSTANTMRLEEAVLNSSSGMGVLGAGSTVNDTTNVDNGYTAEFRLKLASLGFDDKTQMVQIAMTIFDPDGFQFNSALPWPYGMMPFDSARGTYFKSWWGSEWGDVFKTLKLKSTTGIASTDLVPTVYAMSQNYPNPFNPTTNIKFSVPQSSVVKIVVYDIIGREVATLANGNYAPGYYTVPFNAAHLASGMYLYRMTSTSLKGDQTFTSTKKLMLVK